MSGETKFAAAILLAGTIFSAVGWLVTHTVSNLLSGPILEYDIKVLFQDQRCGKKEKLNSISVKSTNLSRKINFDLLNLILRLDTSNNSKFSSGDIVFQQPAYSSREPIVVTHKAITFPKVSIRPGTALKIIGCFSGVGQPTFHIGSGSNLKPVESGVQTWLARNEFGALLALVISWSVFLVIICYRLSNKAKKTTASEP